MESIAYVAVMIKASFLVISKLLKNKFQIEESFMNKFESIQLSIYSVTVLENSNVF